MLPTTLVNGDFIVDPETRAEAERLSETSHDRKLSKLVAVLDDGSEIVLAPSLTEFVTHILQRLPAGPISARSLPDELTTTAAADVLGVSRRTLMKWIDSEKISSRRVGSHHRLATVDVFDLRDRRQADRDRAFQSLRDLDDVLEGAGVTEGPLSAQ